MLSLLFLQESLQLFSTVMETSLATSLCRHGVISSNQLHSVRQASNQCVWSVIFRKNPCISSNFSARILKQKSWTWSHKRPSSFIYIFTFFALFTEADSGRFHPPPRRLIQGSAKLRSEGGLEMSQSHSQRESKAIFSAQQHICEFMEKVIA